MAGIYTVHGEIDLDPCGHSLRPVIAHRRILLSEGGDGLVNEWSGKVAFVNPSYSQLFRWLKRAHAQWRAGKVETVVCLVPVRTDFAWFHETLIPDAHIDLLRGARPPSRYASHKPVYLFLAAGPDTGGYAQAAGPVRTTGPGVLAGPRRQGGIR
jgi:hypothetical protein